MSRKTIQSGEMRVFLNTWNAQKHGHRMSICPGKHLEGRADLPTEFFDSKNEPISFEVVFYATVPGQPGGYALVPAAVGNYLIEQKMASKTRIQRMPPEHEAAMVGMHA